MKEVGTKSILIYNGGSALALFLGCTIGFAFTKPTYDDTDKLISWDDGIVDSPTAAGVGVGIGIGIWVLSIILAYIYAESPSRGEEDEDDIVHFEEKSVLWSIMGWPGCDSLRLNVNQQNHEGWSPNTFASEALAFLSWDTMPIYFGLFIKYIDPILLALMIADTSRSNAYEPYGGYKSSQLAVGWIIFSVAMFLGLFPVLCPVLMMSNKDAKAFEGWDLSIEVSKYFGYDLLSSNFLGFGDG